MSWYLNGNYQISCNVADNRWTHVAVTFDGTIWRAYVDGAACGTYSGAIGTNAGSTFYLGNGYHGYFSGSIDEVVIFDRALSAAEVAALAQGSSGTAPEPPSNLRVIAGN
jgi:hypothetical protein